MKRNLSRRRGGWFLWIGGACFLAGSLVAGSYGLASSATNGPTVSGTVTANQGTPGSSSWPVSASQSGTWQQELTDGTNVLGTSDHPVRTDPTGTTTQPVSGTVGLGAGSSTIGNVGISGSLPAGTNDIGTVHVAAPTPTVGEVNCTVPDGDTACEAAVVQLDSAPAGSVLNTLSFHCNTLPGQRLETFWNDTISGQVDVQLSLQNTFFGQDNYSGTLTNLDVPVEGTDNLFQLGQDYTASSGNGTFCAFTYIFTAP